MRQYTRNSAGAIIASRRQKLYSDAGIEINKIFHRTGVGLIDLKRRIKDNSLIISCNPAVRISLNDLNTDANYRRDKQIVIETIRMFGKILNIIDLQNHKNRLIDMANADIFSDTTNVSLSATENDDTSVIDNGIDAEILNVQELAGILKMHKRGIYRLVKLNRIPYFKIGKKLKFNKTHIFNFINKSSKGPI